MQKNKKVIITSVVALAVASCVILTSFALKSNSVSADNVGNELSINDESIEMIFEELEKIKTLIKSGDNTLGFGDTEEALYLYELALSGLAELELSYIEEPEYETIINEIETIAKELTYKIEEVKNSLESEEVIPENNSVNDTSSESSTEISTTSTNTTTSNTNTSTNTNTNTNTNSNSSSANTSNSTSGSISNNISNYNSSTSIPTETPTTTNDSSNPISYNTSSNSSSESTTNSNNSSNYNSTPNTSTSEDELGAKIDDFFKDAQGSGTPAVQEFANLSQYGEMGNVVGH